MRGAFPKLEPGDCLTRDEFERRYALMPRLKKAELVERIVYLGGPVDWAHGTSHANLTGWLGVYQASTPGASAGNSASVRLDQDNEFQPDSILIVEASSGGRARSGDDGILEGAPELVAEVSGSAASIDMNSKLRVYRRNGVREYVVWRVYDEAIDYFALRAGEYIQLAAVDGIVRSEVFPGLWLDVAAMLRGDLAGVLRVLQEGVATPAHTEFVKRLEANRNATGGR